MSISANMRHANPMRISAVSLMLAIMFLLSPSSWAQNFPALSGHVVDAANILSPATETKLSAKLEELESLNGRQVVVATVPSLNDLEISDYAYQLGRSWGIGTREKNDGAVFLVAPNERRVWITVGYGLEAVLTDAVSGRIIRDQVTPAFRAGDMDRGVELGTEAIIHQLLLPPEQAAADAQAAAAQANRNNASSGDDIVGIVIFLGIIFFFFILPAIVAATGNRRYGRGGRVVTWGPGWGGGMSSGGGLGGGGFSGGGFSGGGFSGGGGGFSGGGGSFGGGGAGGSW